MRDAFHLLGHDAWSCDLLPAAGNHFQCNVLTILELNWDLMIAHPPCTLIACSANRHIKSRPPGAIERALEFGRQLWLAPIPRICIENPRSRLSSVLGKRSQEIQPWQFGHGECKATWLWLKNLPLLQPTKIETNRAQKVWRSFGGNSRDRWKRSLTYPGIAKAMAQQWNF